MYKFKFYNYETKINPREFIIANYYRFICLKINSEEYSLLASPKECEIFIDVIKMSGIYYEDITDATVYVNGVNIGSYPYHTYVKKGTKVKIEIYKDGYADYCCDEYFTTSDTEEDLQVAMIELYPITN